MNEVSVSMGEREWQGQRDQDAHDACVDVVKTYVHNPDVLDFAVAHRVVEAVLKIVDGAAVCGETPNPKKAR